MTRKPAPFVYIVTQGSYSDYRIISVFTGDADGKNRADAEVALCGPEGNIEKHLLNPPALRTFIVVNVVMTWDGKVLHTFQSARTVRHKKTRIGVTPNTRPQAKRYCESTVEGTVFTAFTARAVKVVNEKRVQMIAANDPEYLKWCKWKEEGKFD